ncbi:MAG: ABC transporter ATP-binding protein [Candidatus Omnitrophica bacterium]|jgi:phospholipid/cholesterol/gamma-HCH transport system ATP-binding protein|nr:ABC transporter ATP-binding protein [Candidatus Omnitrophota bacterium]
MEKKEVSIEVKDLVKSFNGRTVLNGINLKVYKGETLVIMGGSGCGKSTLLRHMIGTHKPDSGTVIIKGKDITTLGESEFDKIRKIYGMVFQNAALYDSMTVKENIALALKEHTRLAPDIIDIMVKMKLELVGLRSFENFMPSELSGGMRRRVGLARAISMDPEIVFYDEPTAGLDPIVAGVIDKLILDLSKKLHITSVVVTHDMKSVFSIADRIIMLYNGKVIAEGAVDEIKNSADLRVKQFVTGNPDGPIQFFRSGEGYLEELTK